MIILKIEKTGAEPRNEMNRLSFIQQRKEKYIVIQHIQYKTAISPSHDDKLRNTIICSTNSLLKPDVSFSWAINGGATWAGR